VFGPAVLRREPVIGKMLRMNDNEAENFCPEGVSLDIALLF
jgi:hypothetical protein